MEKMSKNSTKIHAAAALTVAAVIIGFCFAAMGAILTMRDHDSESVPCGEAKAVSQNMEKNVLLTMNGVPTRQRVTYDHAEDTVLIETSASLSGSTTGSTKAVIALDYARELVFISIADQNVCLGSELYAPMADQVMNFMRDNTEDTIDIASTTMERLNYKSEGEIPTSYVSGSNGPIVKGLCAGHTSYWTKATTNQATIQAGNYADNTSSMDDPELEIGSVTITVCVFGVCFTFTIYF